MKTHPGPAGHRILMVCLLLAALAGPGCGDRDAEPRTAPATGHPARGKVSDRFPDVRLRTQHGDEVRFYEDLVKDRVVVVNLMYTTCTEICPGTTANLMQVHELLGDRMGRDVTFLSLTLDPEIDTPDMLRRYWEAFGSPEGWLYLTGDYDEIDDLRHKLGVYDLDPVIDADKTQHSGVLTFGNDRTDRWAALPALMDSRGIVETILRFTEDEEFGRGADRDRDEGPRSHRARGVVRAIRADEEQLVIEHEDIPELMPAMTMAFDVAHPALLEGLEPGQAIAFRVARDKDRFVIEAIRPLPDTR